MQRREFLISSALAGGGLWLAGGLAGCRVRPEPRELPGLLRGLLRDWCETLVRCQHDEPGNRSSHGGIGCPACGFIHGRCFEAVRPLLEHAALTGNLAFRDAAMRLFEWSVNVDAPDGAWTNDLDPKSWKGTTVFGVIAVAQALRRHEALLASATVRRWRERLRPAAEWVFRSVDLQYGNINYGCSALLALALAGRVLGEPSFRARARELAAGVAEFFSSPNQLLCGEGRPAGRRSAKGCLPVDLAYNVEESLPALIEYAQLEGDDALLQRVTESALQHLEFMLPDGAWDNSWGTRSYKWTYWGGRTSEGCQAGFLRLASHRAVFATAALRNTRLLRADTHEGVLCGGRDGWTTGRTPCIHHTLSHAGAIAGALELGAALEGFDPTAPLPRDTAEGVKSFLEIDTHLVARGPWRATITGYDWLYQPRAVHATGGMLALLWHSRSGPIFAASQAEYHAIEAKNMETDDGSAFPMTPRLELPRGGRRYSSLFALDAEIRSRTADAAIEVDVATRVALPRDVTDPEAPLRFSVRYRFTEQSVELAVTPATSLGASQPWVLVLPVICGEKQRVARIDPRHVHVNGVRFTASCRIDAEFGLARRQFNPAPGFTAVPLRLASLGATPITCTISVPPGRRD